MEKVAAEFLSHLNIPVSKRYVEQLITAHPDFPSLLSVSDVFTRLGVNHRVTRIEQDKLADVEYPYLLPLDKGRGDVLLIDSHESLRKNNNLLAEWGGVILLAETSKTTSDSDNNNLYSKERGIKIYTLLAGFAFVSLLVASQLNSFFWVNGVLLALSLCGVLTGYFLFAKELGITYAAVDAFCNTGKNTNCDAILKSEVSILSVKLSEATVTYFLFQIFLLGLGPSLSLETPIVSMLAALSLLTLPIILFSLYYQYFVAKTWCRLCLVVIAILLVQAGLLGYALPAGYISKQGLTFMTVAGMILMGLLLLAFVLLVKSTLERYEKLNQQGGTGNRVKHSASVFLSFLQKQRIIDHTRFENEMMIGNPDAPIKIIMASNLFCNPCKLKHEVAAQLLAIYLENIQITMRFVKSGKDPDSVSHLLNFWYQFIKGEENESNRTMSLLHDWFTIWDLKKFKEKYPVAASKPEMARLEEQHYIWMNEADIRQTPTFVINGYEMPKEYGLEDLMAMVPALSNSMKKIENKEMTAVMNN
jgi:hypothetical protein